MAAAAFLALLLAPVAAVADPFEPDDTSATAKRVAVNAPAQQHDFGKRGDRDWIYFYACDHTSYSIAAANASTTCDPAFTLYAADGRTTISRVFSKPGFPLGEVDENGPHEGETYIIHRLPAGFYFVRFRNADPNTFGTTVTYWVSVNEITGGGIPIETVDERTIGIHPKPTPGPTGRAAMAVLTPWNRGNRPPYTRHRIEFPNYEETTTGSAIDVSICWARTKVPDVPDDKFGGPGLPGQGQVFPGASAVLFVVKAVQWSGGKATAKAFTDPVNIVVEFAPYDAPTVLWNDVVTFNGDVSTPDKMRIVRDMTDGPGVNFQFLPVLAGAQQVDTAQRTVTILNYRNLTGISGQATYGAVANDITRAGHWALYE
jgi:hypothetical protein